MELMVNPVIESEILNIENVINNHTGAHPAHIKQAKETMMPYYEELKEIAIAASAIVVESDTDIEQMKLAADLLKRAVKNRTGSAKAKKEGKEIVLATGKLWDALGNEIEKNSKIVEAHLTAKAKFTELRIEKAAKELHETRSNELQEKGLLAYIFGNPDFGRMKQEEYEQCVFAADAAKNAAEERARKAQEEAAREQTLTARRITLAGLAGYIAASAVDLPDADYQAAVSAAKQAKEAADAETRKKLEELDAIKAMQSEVPIVPPVVQETCKPQYVVRLEGSGKEVQRIFVTAYTGQQLVLCNNTDGTWSSESVVTDGDPLNVVF